MPIVACYQRLRLHSASLARLVHAPRNLNQAKHAANRHRSHYAPLVKSQYFARGVNCWEGQRLTATNYLLNNHLESFFESVHRHTRFPGWIQPCSSDHGVPGCQGVRIVAMG